MISLLPTKFYLPPAPTGFVARPQLRKLLDEVLTHRLTLVSAPAGAGKTTLVSDWVENIQKKGAACGWLSLDEADNTPERFLEYLVACLEEAGLVIDPARLFGDGEGAPKAETVLAEIIRGLVSIRRALILVLDDYHLIHNSEIHTALEYLIERAPTCLHLVILTRSDPPFGLARLRVGGQLLELRMDQLRFSEPEAAEFLMKASVVDLPDSEISALNARTEGWVAGLQMAAISMRGRADAASFVSAFTASNRYVFDYLLEQVLNRQPGEVREFLLKTSILDRLTAPLCDAVFETGNSSRGMLEILEKENLFLIPLDDERGWYRYHHLFANLLRLLLEQEYPGLTPEFHRRACRWYEAQGMLPEALEYAISSGDMQLVVEIVSSNVLILLENNEVTPTLEKIDSIPFETLITHSWLGIARAWALGVGQIPKSMQLLDAVEKNLEQITNEVERRRIRGHIAAARGFVFGSLANRVKSLEQAQLADELLPPDELAIRAMNLDLWGNVLIHSGNDAEAIAILERAFALALEANKMHLALITLGSISTAHLFAGRIREVHRVCLEGVKLADEYQKRYQRTISAAAEIYTQLARVLAEWGESEESIIVAQKALGLSRRWGRVASELVSQEYLGRALVFANRWKEAREVFQRAEASTYKIEPTAWKRALFYYLDSMLDSDEPDPSEIARERCRAENCGIPLPEILNARLKLRDKQPDQALVLLDAFLSRGSGHVAYDLVRVYALRALAYQEKGETQTAFEWLRQTLELAEPENRVMSIVREGPAMENLLRHAKAKGMSSLFTQRLLTVFENRRATKAKPALIAKTREEPGALIESAALLEPLSERELEVLQHLNSYLSTPEIADLLVVSANTVRTHIKNIYGKLGVHGRSGAVKRSRELGLII